MPTIPTTPETCYQGYTNHATWAACEWLYNDHETYLFCRRLTRKARLDAEDCEQVAEGIWTEADASRYLLADRLKEYLAELNPLQNQPSVFSNLMTSALDDVNYRELAETFLE